MANTLPSAGAQDRALAASLLLAWQAADAPLQAAIQRAIRTHAHRTPAFVPQLRSVLAYYAALRSLPASSPRWLASNLYAAWSIADPPLRMDLEAVMRAYVARQPAFLYDLGEVLALHQRIAAMGWAEVLAFYQHIAAMGWA